MRAALKRLRDNPFVLSACVFVLKLFRSVGLFKSERIYSHVPFQGVVTVDCGHGTSYRIQSRGGQIENGLYWEGFFAHEPATMAHWNNHASAANVVLDIGANSGIFALAAAAAGAKSVHAFEPLPRMFDILAKNARLNNFPTLKVWPCAVGATSGTATLFDPGGDAPTSASLSEAFSKEHFGTLPETQINVVSIDDFCDKQHVGMVDLIKIDVEGYEQFALLGMQETVRRYKPVILMEVLDGQEAILRKVVESLWPGNYSWSKIDEGHGHVSRNVLLEPKKS